MEVDLKKDSQKAEAELKVSVSVDELTPYVKEAAKKLSQEREIKGFRPGKAPMDVVADVLGEERLMNEVIERAVPQFFVRAAIANEIDAIDRPNVAINKISRKEGMEFTATVAILPEVVLGDLNKIKAEKKEVKADEKEIEKELERLARMRSQAIEVARPAQAGDVVKADFIIRMNGELMEGGDMKEQDIELGSGQFLPDFEEKLIGINAGDEREFTMKFPEQHQEEALRGKEAMAVVKAHAVQKKVLPEINDEFAKGLGGFTDLADLKGKLANNIKQEKEHKEKERYQAELMAQLAKLATVKVVPGVLVAKEIDRQLEEFNQMLSMYGKSIEDFAKERGRTQEQIREEMRAKAEENVKIGLALREFVKQEKIEVSEEEVQGKVTEFLARYPSKEEAEKAVDPQELEERLEGMLRNTKAMERLEMIVRGEKTT